MSVSEESKYSDDLTSDGVDMRLYGGLKIEDFRCSEIGMTAKEFLKDIKTQPKQKTIAQTKPSASQLIKNKKRKQDDK